MVSSAGVYAIAAGIGGVAGIFIGMIGIGGILLVPALIQLPGISVQVAVATSLFSYIFAGLAGSTAYMYQSTISRRHVLWIVIGAIPGSVAAPFAIDHISDLVIKILLYSVIILSALFSSYRSILEFKQKTDSNDDAPIRRTHNEQRKKNPQSRISTNENTTEVGRTVNVLEEDAQIEQVDVQQQVEDGKDSCKRNSDGLAINVAENVDSSIDVLKNDEKHTDGSDVVVSLKESSKVVEEEKMIVSISETIIRFGIGAFTGFGSAITGSSGPVLLLPILISMRWEVFIALGCSQVIQIPIAIASVLAYVIGRPGVIDFALGGCLAGPLVPSIFLGAYLAHKIQPRTLKLIVSVLLIVCGIGLFVQLIMTEWA